MEKKYEHVMNNLNIFIFLNQDGLMSVQDIV